jgi:O-antigen/teichoic acid export membrane protein
MIAGIAFIVMGFIFWIDKSMGAAHWIAVLVGVVGILLLLAAINTPEDPTHQRWTHFQ